MNLNLYDILNDIITESVSPNDVSDALSNQYRVLINYDDDKYHKTGTRLIEPYVYGLTKAGNPAIRAYQYNGDTARGNPKWKLFRLDRIQQWKPTEEHFNVEPRDNGWKAEAYNEEGDNSMSTILQQIQLTNPNEYETFSPNNLLQKVRQERERLQNSKPTNIHDYDFTNTQQSSAIENQVTKDFELQQTNVLAHNGENKNVYDSHSGPKDNKTVQDFWAEYDAAQAEANAQNAESDKAHDDNINHRRDNRWQNSSDIRNLYRKNALNNEI